MADGDTVQMDPPPNLLEEIRATIKREHRGRRARRLRVAFDVYVAVGAMAGIVDLVWRLLK